MVQVVIAADSDTCGVGIADQRKNMAARWRGKAVGIGDGLQADGREGQDQVETAAGYIFRDGVCGADVSLGVVLGKGHAAAIRIASLFQGPEGSGQALIQRGY